MEDAVELREVGRKMRHLWWIPLLLAVIGATAGIFASGRIERVHRAEASLVVGSVDEPVTRDSTLNASESQAAFYADLARRQVVLQPVAEENGTTWRALLPKVGAQVPDRNPRVVTISVTGASEATATAIAQDLVDQMLELKAPGVAVEDRAFVESQRAGLRALIDQTTSRIKRLQTELSGTRDPDRRATLTAELDNRTELLDSSRRTYVQLLSLDDTGDAGSLSVLDEVRPTTALDRAGLATQAATGAAIGLALGMLVLLIPRRQRSTDRRRAGREPEPPKRATKASTQAQPRTTRREPVLVRGVGSRPHET